MFAVPVISTTAPLTDETLQYCRKDVLAGANLTDACYMAFEKHSDLSFVQHTLSMGIAMTSFFLNRLWML